MNKKIEAKMRKIILDLYNSKERQTELGLRPLDTALSELSLLMEEEYIKGWNDNARDCYCEDVTLNISGHHVKPKPHQHLMDDGKSHNIRPDIVRESK